MKKIILATLMIACFNVMAVTNVNAQKKTSEELQYFPKQLDGYDRYVIYLKKNKNEDNLKVEIIPGKMMEVDCNNHRLMGKIEEKDVKGMGYTYYIFESNGEAASTMMFCPDAKSNKFVTGATQLIRYNSLLPIVVFAPKGMEIKYKIWKADKLQKAVQE